MLNEQQLRQRIEEVRTGERSRTFHYRSVTYEPLADSMFELPPAVTALRK